MFEGGFEEFGAIRYQIEWITIKPSASAKESIDPDTDTITYYEYRGDKEGPIVPVIEGSRLPMSLYRARS